MKKIKIRVKQINEELESAKEYMEEAIWHKANGNSSLYNRFREMSLDESKHATALHEVVVNEIEKLKSSYTVPESMLTKWEECHHKYVEESAMIKHMQSM